jgi:hypothetical protein
MTVAAAVCDGVVEAILVEVVEEEGYMSTGEFEMPGVAVISMVVVATVVGMMVIAVVTADGEEGRM